MVIYCTKHNRIKIGKIKDSKTLVILLKPTRQTKPAKRQRVRAAAGIKMWAAQLSKAVKSRPSAAKEAASAVPATPAAKAAKPTA